jgi:hypothetical protein
MVYFIAAGLMRYGLWFIYGAFSGSPGATMRVFMTVSGLIGLIVCIAAIVLLWRDRKRRWVSFLQFGPESWNASPPAPVQWTGLLVAGIALWYPFVPDPAVPWMSVFTFGYPSSFGVTLAPVLMFLSGLFLAGRRAPNPEPVLVAGLGCIVAAIATEPITIHGIATALMGIVMPVMALRAGKRAGR